MRLLDESDCELAVDDPLRVLRLLEAFVPDDAERNKWRMMDAEPAALVFASKAESDFRNPVNPRDVIRDDIAPKTSF